jgi:hypothetical protein
MRVCTTEEKKRKQKVRGLNVGDEAEAKRRGKVRYYVINEIWGGNHSYHTKSWMVETRAYNRE